MLKAINMGCIFTIEADFARFFPFGTHIALSN